MGFNTPFVSLGIDARTGKSYHLCSKKSLLSFAIVALLVLTMASERLVFKAMIDRMESYRYFLCQVMTFLFIPPLFCIVGYKSTQEEFIEEDVYEFSKLHFLAMGMLDLLHAMMLFIAGGMTEPMQTLLFMQASIPVTTLLSALIFRTRYSKTQLLGNILMAAGLVVAFLPTLEDFDSDSLEDRKVAWNSLFYLLAAIPGALSMLYKERAIRDQPMDMVYLNAWVTVYQFIGGLMLAPFVFDFEMLHLDQKMSGLECLINGKSEVETDHCQYGLLLLVFYVASNVVINVLIVRLIRMTNVSVLNNTTLLGFAASFLFLAWYELDPNGFGVHLIRVWFSQTTLVLDFVAFVALFAGKLLYQYDPDPDMEATTTSAEDKEAMSLLMEDDYGMRYTTMAMSVASKQTATRLAKVKKPLTDMHQLQRAVKELQREAADQLVLEVESQATFEFLTSQIKALKSAFDTLSDVLMNEIDGLRKDTTRKLSDMEAQVNRQTEMHKATHTEVMQLKRTMEIWSLKERDWAKDNEILKASHSHNVEWMQQLQRDVMEIKDKMHEFKSDVSYRITDLCEETNNLRVHWQKQVEDMTEQLQEYDCTAQKQAQETRSQAQQRADDLEVMEQALTTVQKQQLQVRANLEDHVQSIASQTALLVKKLEFLESQTGSQRATIDQLKQKSTSMEKEQRKRMEHISKMFTVFAEALNISPATLGPAGRMA